MARCYDKYEAHRIASAAGFDCPATVLGTAAGEIAFPLILKPRRGSDSIGVRLLKTGPLPARARSDQFIVQERVIGSELTIAVIHGRAGKPLQIVLPEGVPYSFLRKYLLRPGRSPLADVGLAARVERVALRIAEALAVDWAARVDLVHETATGRLRLLECDVAPLVGPDSAFAASLAAGGMTRGEQLRLLLDAGDSRARG
jgi:D-alanine-D-alanine ligase-like ATP-grasp enzyme